MNYEEKTINGVLMRRTQPDGQWKPVSPAEMTARLAEKEFVIKSIFAESEKLDAIRNLTAILAKAFKAGQKSRPDVEWQPIETAPRD